MEKLSKKLNLNPKLFKKISPNKDEYGDALDYRCDYVISKDFTRGIPIFCGCLSVPAFMGAGLATLAGNNGAVLFDVDLGVAILGVGAVMTCCSAINTLAKKNKYLNQADAQEMAEEK